MTLHRTMKLEKDWNSYDATIYTDGAATHGNANGGSGIIVTPLAPKVTLASTIPAGKWCSSFQAEEKAVRTALYLVQEDVSLHRVRIVSDSMSTLQHMQNLHPSKQVANSDENVILDTLSSPTDRGCHLTFTWCSSHSGICGSELADLDAKEVTTVVQEGVSHYDSVKTSIQQATKEPCIAHERLRRIYGEIGEKVGHKLESLQLSRMPKVSIS